MPYEAITSRENRLIKDTVRLLSSAKARKQQGLFVLEGLRLCRDAVRFGFKPETVLFTDALMEAHRDDADEICSAAKKAFCISESVAEKLGDTETVQGIFCILKIPNFRELDGKGKYIGLENLSDPSNLGAVARTAEAFGIDGIVMFGSSCDPFAPKAQRAAMGALVRLPVYFFDGVDQFKSAYPEINIFAAVVQNGESVNKADFSAPCMVVIGNEANGLTERACECCDKRLTLHMGGRAESLNAAVAASIFMWEMVR